MLILFNRSISIAWCRFFYIVSRFLYKDNCCLSVYYAVWFMWFSVTALNFQIYAKVESKYHAFTKVNQSSNSSPVFHMAIENKFLREFHSFMVS